MEKVETRDGVRFFAVPTLAGEGRVAPRLNASA